MQEFRKLNKNIKLRTLTVFLTVLLGSSIYPNMTIYYVHHFNAFIAGILLIIVSIVGFIAGLYGGHLADLIGRKQVMVIASLMILVGYIIAAISNSPLTINPYTTFIGFLLASAGGSFADPAEQAMMIDSSTEENRQYIYSLIYWILNIGVMIGAAIGGWFFKDYMFELMIASAIVAIINSYIVIKLMTETLPEESKNSKSNQHSIIEILKSYLGVLKDKAYSLFLVAMIFSTVIFMQPDYYLAAHLGESFKTTYLFGLTIYGQRMLSIMIIVNTVIIVLFMTSLSNFTKKFPLLKTFALGTFLQALGFALSFIFDTFTPLIVAAVILTIGEMINVPSSQVIRADLMDKRKIGVYSGATSAVRPIGMILSGFMVSISGIVGNYVLAIVLVIFSFISIILTTLAAKMKKIA